MIKLILMSAILFGSIHAYACPGMKGSCENGQCKLKKNDVVALLKLEGERADQVMSLQKKHARELLLLKKEYKDKMRSKRAFQQEQLNALLDNGEIQKLEKMKAAHKSKGKYCPHSKKHLH